MALNDVLKKIELLSKELDQMRPISPEQETRIMDKFRLDWNYNSNHLEGNRLTFGETKALLLHGITAQGKPLKDHIEIQGHDEALKYIEEVVKQNRPLTENFIRELHQMILREPYEVEAITPEGEPTRRIVQIGQYKSTPNHVLTKSGEIFRFSTPEETPSMMHDLVSWLRGEIDEGKNPILLTAAEFHYRFVRIHPFDDGNGRLVRILMNFILMMKGYPPIIIKADKKAEYFTALQLADSGNIEAFFIYVGELMIKSLEIMIKGAKGEEIEEMDDVDKELALLKEELKKKEDVRFSKNNETILSLWQSSFYNLFEMIHNKLTQFDDLFLLKREFCYVNGGFSIIPGDKYNSSINREFDEIIQLAKRRDASKGDQERFASQTRKLENKRIDTISYQCIWEGFKKSQENPFDLNTAIEIQFEKMKYKVKSTGHSQGTFYDISKLYHEILSASEIEEITKAVAKNVLSRIKDQLSQKPHH